MWVGEWKKKYVYFSRKETFFPYVLYIRYLFIVKKENPSDRVCYFQTAFFFVNFISLKKKKIPTKQIRIEEQRIAIFQSQRDVRRNGAKLWTYMSVMALKIVWMVMIDF